MSSAHILLGLILAVALGVRAYEIGRASFWYDEVVTMRLARTPGPGAMVGLLGEIDATRAPLHPLALMGWLRVFGTSEAAARGLSAVCGVLTVLWVWRLGRRDGEAAGLWGAWLAAVSPLLIVYSREARMYAWLVLMTCLAWDALLGLKADSPTWRRLMYPLAAAALVYSHPLGLLMAATLAMAAWWDRAALGIAGGRWWLLHGLAAALVLPWIERYFDHAPEMVVGTLSPRFLLGTPIGFVGGNFLTLVGFSGLIALGAWGVRLRGAAPFLLWLVVPPTVLYAYSWLSHPIFGPARYTLFVAPPYVILIGRGLARLGWFGGVVGLGATALAVSAWPSQVYAPDLKADWRTMAARLAKEDPAEPVVVVSNAPERNVEVETARYYLPGARPLLAWPLRETDRAILARREGPVWVAVGVRDGRLVAEVPEGFTAGREARVIDADGLRLIEAAGPR